MRQNFTNKATLHVISAIGAFLSLLIAPTANGEELTTEFLTSHNVYQAYMTGPWAGQYQGCYDYNYGGGYFESKADGTLTLHNFYTDGIDVDVTLENNTLSFPLKEYSITRGKYQGCTATLIPSSWEYNTTAIDDKTYAYIVPDKYYDYSKPYKIALQYSWGDQWNNWSMRYNDSNVPGIIIDIKDADHNTVDVLTYIDGYFTVRDVPNAKARDYDKDGNLIREYNVMTSWIETGLYVKNLNCRGLNLINHGISDNPVEITASWIEWTNELWYRSQNVGSITDFSNFESLGYKTINYKDAYWFSYDTSVLCQLVNDTFEQQYYKNGGTAEAGEVHGEFIVTGDDVNHNHVDTSCPWIDCDGDRLTHGGYAMRLYNYGLLKKGAVNTNGSKDYLEEYSYTEIMGTDADYTLDVDLDLTAFGANSNCIYVKGTIKPQKNTLFVDHYELCIKADKAESVTQFPQVNENTPYTIDDDDEDIENDYRTAPNGFPGSTNLYKKGNVNQSTNARSFRIARANNVSESSNDAAEEIEFEKLISTSELTETAENPYDYRFYIKAVYKSEYYDESKGINQGLSPTYHSVSGFTGQLTGVEDVAYNENSVSITGENGMINVFGEYNTVTVYSTSGATIYSGNSHTITVPAGIYIVKADNTTAKIRIK